MEKVVVIIEKSNTGYSAYLPDLHGCVSTAATIDEIKTNIAEAINFHLEGMAEDKLPVPAQFKKW